MTNQPRLMTGADAAAYLDLTPAAFSKWVAQGIIPKPLAGTRRWDRKALDLALDKASDLAAPSAVPECDAEDEWERRYAARKNTAGLGIGK